MRVLKFFLLSSLLLLLPAPAWAWGPAAHLDLGLTILKDLTLLAPAVAVLLRKFPNDFLYGSIAADITVGKDLSPYHLHCHNWQVGFSVLDLASAEDTRAFAWGYLSHLAADIVAHNYFIPYKIIQHFQHRRALHAYWEIRFDTWVSRETWKEARTLSTHAFKKHDRHLHQILTDPIFSFRINKRIFNSMVLFNQILRWQRMVNAYARRTRLSLTEEEVEEMRGRSLAMVIDLLTNCTQANCLRVDPTGHRNLLIARDVRKRLRSLDQEGRLLNPHEIGKRFRPLFRQAIHSKLALPSMLELINPEAPPVQEQKRAILRRGKRPGEPSDPRRRRTILHRLKKP